MLNAFRYSQRNPSKCLRSNHRSNCRTNKRTPWRNPRSKSWRNPIISEEFLLGLFKYFLIVFQQLFLLGVVHKFLEVCQQALLKESQKDFRTTNAWRNSSSLPGATPTEIPKGVSNEFPKRILRKILEDV